MAGAVWAIIAALSFSLGHIALSKGIRISGIALGTALMLAAATIVGAVVALAVDGWGALVAGTGAGFGFFVAAGTIHFVGGGGFMNASTRLIGPSRMAAITGVTPMFAALLAVLFLNETMNLYVGAGILAIVAGTYFIATS
jgi:drug/metabolite transporter (DMT)-like permease